MIGTSKAEEEKSSLACPVHLSGREVQDFDLFPRIGTEGVRAISICNNELRYYFSRGVSGTVRIMDLDLFDFLKTQNYNLT